MTGAEGEAEGGASSDSSTVWSEFGFVDTEGFNMLLLELLVVDPVSQD